MLLYKDEEKTNKAKTIVEMYGLTRVRVAFLFPLFSDLQDVAADHNLNSKASFRHEVQTATFDEANAHWVVEVFSLETKKTTTHTARVLFSCVGALSVPRKCDVPGTENFKGKIFHSARWDSSVELQNKNVIVLGA